MASAKKSMTSGGQTKFSTIDDYHASFSVDIQRVLQDLRQSIRKAAPQAIETISYNMPTFKMNKNLVHYAAYKAHIGFYPTSRPILIFKNELTKYKTSKGAIQFPIDKPLPKHLIRKIVRYRVEQDSEYFSGNRTIRKCKHGHRYPYNSDCPDCPICENSKRSRHGFLALVTAPARRSLENSGVKTLRQLSKYSENDILKLHGVGRSTIRILQMELEKAGLHFTE